MSAITPHDPTGPGSYPPLTPQPVIGSTDTDAIYLGRLLTDQGYGPKLQYGGEQHIVVLGPNGKGKGTRFLIPNLLQLAGSSVVVVDTKGELAAVTAKFRRSLGPVIIINPFGVFANRPGYSDMRSVGFNPLARLDPFSPSFNADAALIAEALIPLGDDVREPHWPLSARNLVAALVMYVTIEANKLGRPATMQRLRELLCLPSLQRSSLKPEGVGLPVLVEKIMHLGEGQPQLWHNWEGMRNAASQFYDYTKEVASIASTARAQTAAFDDVEVVADTQRDGFDFRQMKRQPVTVYVCLPPDMVARHSKWLRLVLTAALQGVMREKRRGEPKCLFMLDEFFALGHLDVIARTWALVRGYGIQMMPVLQDLPQLKKLYPDNWETFLGMAGAVISFAPNDLTTAKWLSDRTGETERQIKSTSKGSSTSTTKGYNSGNSSGSSSNGGNPGYNSGSSSGFSFSRSHNETSGTSWNAVKVPFMTPHQLYGLPNDKLVGFVDGQSNMLPIWGPDYLHMTEVEGRARDNPYYTSGDLPPDDGGKRTLTLDAIPLAGLFGAFGEPLLPPDAAVRSQHPPAKPPPQILHRSRPRGRRTWQKGR